MKFRHSLIIGCLTALLGFGAFLGAGVSKEAKVEKAEATTSRRIYIDSEELLAGFDNLVFWNGSANVNKSGSLSSTDVIIDGRGTLGRRIHYLDDTTFNDIYIKNGGGSDEWGPVNPSNSNTLYKLTSWGNKGTYETKHIYKVHVVDNNTTYDEYFVTEWTKYEAPTPKGKTDYVFAGWYTDSSFETEFNGVEKSAGTRDFSLYAKYETASTADVYVDAFSDWGDLYIYVYEMVTGIKNEYYGAFPGLHVGINDSNLRFNGGQLQKVTIPYVNSSNVKFIYNDNGYHQSADMSLSSGAYYWHNGSSWTYDSAHYANAAKFVYDLNTARLAVTASGDIKAFSICGLYAKEWVDKYDLLSSTAQGYVNSATIYTYKDAESTGADQTVTFEEVIETLRDRYSLPDPKASRLELPTESSTSTSFIVVILATTSVVAAAGFVFLKKKRSI